MKPYLIALDQGTTSSRAIVFDQKGNVAGISQRPFAQIYPQPGWVEHDPMVILYTQIEALSEAFRTSGATKTEISAIGITNQRETTIVWDRFTGRPVYNAIVWQCRRTAALCDQIVSEGMSEYIRSKTGLIPDAYFSATKIRWILDNVPGARQRAERGDLLFGTVDSWLIWNLTEEKNHITDYSNASRTMLFDIHTMQWDEELCRYLDIPVTMLPKPVPNCYDFGHLSAGLPGMEELAGVPICGVAGDQQAALLGQGCLQPGDTKNTYGTGCFTMMNTGDVPTMSRHGLLSSVAWDIHGQIRYCLEGSVFNAGSTVQWLRDELRMIHSAGETQVLAESVPDNGGVYLVPAFTGLGAPHWDMYARGTISGLTRGTTRAHIIRAALEGIAYQVKDLIDAMEQDSGAPLQCLRVDGGASVNRFLMQFQSDILGKPIDRPQMVETTALGAAFLAGLQAGVWDSIEDIVQIRHSDVIFTPSMDSARAEYLCSRWHDAVNCAKGWEK